jgi:hypothetical protein
LLLRLLRLLRLLLLMLLMLLQALRVGVVRFIGVGNRVAFSEDRSPSPPHTASNGSDGICKRTPGSTCGSRRKEEGDI